SRTIAVWMASRANASKLAIVMLGQLVLQLEIQLVENPLVLVAAFRRVVPAAGRSVCRRSATKARLRGLWWQSLGIRTAFARLRGRRSLCGDHKAPATGDASPGRSSVGGGAKWPVVSPVCPPPRSCLQASVPCWPASKLFRGLETRK